MVEVLGQVETELLDFLLEKIRAQATAEEITAELTPVTHLSYKATWYLV